MRYQTHELAVAINHWQMAEAQTAHLLFQALENVTLGYRDELARHDICDRSWFHGAIVTP